uniref:NADH dehydrogenase subunit 4L n=1 Tax=Megalophaedusa pinguis TaxID=2801952 RepID=A0A224A0T0_9EUPU|nr:NADH dehydrogenase subunit 4L [Megalophaedusa pinguis]
MVIIILLLSLLIFLILLFYGVKNRLLPAMLILESIVLMSLLLVLYLLVKISFGLFIFVVPLTFAVCEAGVALSLLMGYIKINGSDLISVKSSHQK